MGIEESKSPQQKSEINDTEVTLGETLKAVSALKALEAAQAEMLTLQNDLIQNPFDVTAHPEKYQGNLESLGSNVTKAADSIQTLYELGLRFNPSFLKDAIDSVSGAYFMIMLASGVLSDLSRSSRRTETQVKNAALALIPLKECEAGLSILNMYFVNPALILNPNLPEDEPTDDPEINLVIKAKDLVREGGDTVRGWLGYPKPKKEDNS